ncbi:DNA-7-methylguanine glycosylase [Duganella sp. CF458]|uniref:DNA alkylation repair protein n=1 Tax=Duganella sp. CF458 TaxID=1884368 RepID=UPI0008E2F8CD|nr:DNA alkylation repair protein [Duganella sp. CF458]SFG69470.1 DNA-7-methylguanine glycosylase [Duganella sp. CF458]
MKRPTGRFFIMPTTKDFVSALTPLADAGRAPAMRAYMRDQFPFLGIATPARRAAIKPVISLFKGVPPAELIGVAGELWQLPEREYQYAALDLMSAQWKQFDTGDLPQLLAFVLRKSWWDSVDGIAGIVGDVLRFDHHGMDSALQHDNFWMRRIALLHQLGWRGKTDEMRLFRYSMALGHENEFFIQKAIGWALRDYARHAPHNVAQFINENNSTLSKLSIREAGRHLTPLG